MIELIPYEPAHAHMILSRNVRERDLWLSGFPGWEETVKIWKDGGPAETVTFDGEPVCSAGIVLIGWGRGEAWALLSTLFYKHVRACYRMIKNRLSGMVKEHGLVRVQTLVAPEFTEGARLVEHLGFDQEGLLKKYGPNHEDLLIYGRVSR